MTTTYTVDAINFSGPATALVQYMHKASRAKEADDTTWMAATARRMKFMSNVDIRTDTADNFIQDLDRAGYLQALATGE